jgi:hypothetical protein
MEQLQRVQLGGMRGAMGTVSMEDVQTFFQRWDSAGAHLVQHWATWEEEAAKFFGAELPPQSALMHGVMRIVRPVMSGTSVDVKRAMREAEPAVLLQMEAVLGHLGTFGSILVAERRFRAGELAVDWSLSITAGGRAIVRSEFRGPKREVEH